MVLFKMTKFYFYVFLVFNLIIGNILAVEEFPDVPAPDFKKTVDYLGWFKSQIKPEKLILNTPDREIEFFLKASREIPSNTRKQFDNFAYNPRQWNEDQYPKLISYIKLFEPFLTKYYNGYFFKKPVYLVKEGSNHIYEVVIYDLSRMFSRAVIAKIWITDNGKFNNKSFIKGIDSIISNSGRLKRSSSTLLYLEACRLEEWAYTSIYQAAKEGLLSENDKEHFSETIIDKCDPNNHKELKLLKSCFAIEKAMNYDQLQLMVSNSIFSSKPKFNKNKVKKHMELFGLNHFLDSKTKLNDFLKTNPEIIVNEMDAYFDEGINLITNSEIFEGKNDSTENITTLRKNSSKKLYFQAFPLYNFSALYEQLKKTKTISTKVCNIF